MPRAADTPAAALPMDPRTRTLLEAGIARTLLRLAAPNMLVLLAQSSIGLIETYFIGRLGTDALAGMALVFPVLMLMQMMSAGAMGGGVSAAIARALGSGRRADAEALVIHALVIALALGLAFTVCVLGGGPWLYRSMGGRGGSLAAALTYSNVIFAGAVLVWVFNSLASAIRGTGNMAVPATVSVVGAVTLLGATPCLIFGLGPFPRLGIAGGAYAVIACYAIGVVVLAGYMASGRCVVRLSWHAARLSRRLFADILRVGALASINTIQVNLTIGIATSLIGRLGPAAIAGYGTAARLEYVLIPLVFGLGGPLVAMVGTAVGAERRRRALRIAWTGAAIAFVLTELIGLAAAAFPMAFLSLFDSDPAMLAAGAQYLRLVGPVYGLFGLGMALYFAAQGAGRIGWPVLASFIRFAIATCGAWLALEWGGGLAEVFLAQGAALAAYGLIIALVVWRGGWRGRATA